MYQLKHYNTQWQHSSNNSSYINSATEIASINADTGGSLKIELHTVIFTVYTANLKANHKSKSTSPSNPIKLSEIPCFCYKSTEAKEQRKIHGC